MVRKGEYLERAVVIPHHPPLEGLYHRGSRSPAVLIVPPHPFQGGSMESPVIAELAWAVTRRGHPTLRFNYRGVGGSQGVFGEGQGAYDDLLIAAGHLRACVADGESLPPIAAVGIGFGAGLAARMAIEAGFSVSPLILISPKLARLPISLPSYRGELVLIRAQEDEDLDLASLDRSASQLSHARCATVPGADPTFLRGLVELGKVVAESVSSSGT